MTIDGRAPQEILHIQMEVHIGGKVMPVTVSCEVGGKRGGKVRFVDVVEAPGTTQ